MNPYLWLSLCPLALLLVAIWKSMANYRERLAWLADLQQIEHRCDQRQVISCHENGGYGTKHQL